MVAWVQANWVALGAILLAVIRLIESLMIVLPKNIQGVLTKILATIKEFFKLG